MPPKKSNLNNAQSREARRRRVERVHLSDEQISARNEAQRIRAAENRAQESQEQRDQRLRQSVIRTRATRKRNVAAAREQERQRKQISRLLNFVSFINPESTDDSESNERCCFSPLPRNRVEKSVKPQDNSKCWQNEHYFRFISLYEEQESLWNPRCAGYREAGARPAALARVAEGMALPDFTVTDVEKKIKYIRSVYKRECKKMEESLSSGAVSVYKPSVDWFNVLDSFLRNVHSGANIAQEPLQNEIKVEFSCDDEDDQKFELHPESVSWGACEESPAKRAREGECGGGGGGEGAGEGEGEREDEFSVFARHVATQLRALPLALALEAQEAIQSALTRYRLRTLRN